MSLCSSRTWIRASTIQICQQAVKHSPYTLRVPTTSISRGRSQRFSHSSFSMADTPTKRSSAFYRELTGLPAFVAADFQDRNVLRVTTIAQDHVRKIKRQGTSTFVINKDVVAAVHHVESPEVVASALAPSGKRLAVFREVSDQGAPEGKKRFVEIWAAGKLETSLEATSIHGSFYADEILSLFSFSPSESTLLYTAETKPDNASNSDAYEKFRFVPPLGEGYAGKRRPGLYILRWDRSDLLSKPSLSRLQVSGTSSHPELLSQPVFASEDRVFAVGYDYTPDKRLLGVKYCPNRPAGIWELRIPPIDSTSQNGNDEKPSEIQCTAARLTPAQLSCRCPRILEDTNGQPSHLIWIANPVGGPHASCATIHSLDLETNDQRVLVDTVLDPKPDNFPGLFTVTLPTHPFLRLGTPNGQASFLVTTSNWRSRTVVLLVSLKDGSVHDLTPDDDHHNYSWNVLTTDDHSQIVCTRSNPSVPPELVVGKVTDSVVDWQVVAKPEMSSSLEKELAKIETSIITVPGRHPVETIVIKPKESGEVPPCITVPHGGPHGASTTGFNVHHALFVVEGYTVSSPNYTGSVGFGETYVRKLLGQIGTLDVQDCISSIKHLIDLGITEAGQGRQFLSGGSHGGFLAAHLIGQYPEFFSAAVLRNPVITMGEISSSDIPDWYLEESGMSFEPTTLITSEVYAKLWALSPLAHVDKVRTPTLLIVGEQDARVSPIQGKSFYHALKGRGRDVDMLCFKDDSHPVESVDAQSVYFEATRDLFAKWRK